MKKIVPVLVLVLMILAIRVAGADSSVCVDSSAGSVCLDLSVPGNTQPESMGNYWPLVQGTNWKFYGMTNGQSYKLQVKVENPQMYEGEMAWPVDFVKNDDISYWSPHSPRNLRWFVVNYDSFLGARGDKRYNRHTLQYINRYWYESLTSGLPPYVLIPRDLAPNPENSGLGNAYLTRHQYYNCSPNCFPLDQHNSWFMGVTNARIKVPYFGDEWVDAKRVEIVELSLPGKYGDELTDPYHPDREFACRMNGEALYYRGVREDWFFVENVGPVLILTREIGLGSDNECVYEVVRENLVFENTDTYIYLVQKGSEGYDPSWSY